MFWIGSQTCHCDDLVTDGAKRSQGFGHTIMEGLKALATREVGAQTRPAALLCCSLNVQLTYMSHLKGLIHSLHVELRLS